MNLKEEKATDKKLSGIAKRKINKKALAAQQKSDAKRPTASSGPRTRCWPRRRAFRRFDFLSFRGGPGGPEPGIQSSLLSATPPWIPGSRTSLRAPE